MTPTQPHDKKPALPVSEPQVRFLLDLTSPDRLERLSNAEARFLIAWLRGPPANMSRAQQLYIAGLIASLNRDQMRKAIDFLVGLSAAGQAADCSSAGTEGAT